MERNVKVRIPKDGGMVKQDHKLYHPGDVFHATKKEAEALVTAGAIEIVGTVTTRGNVEPRPT